MVSSRVRGVSIARPVEYGNLTVPLEAKDRRKDTPQDHTHKWTVFIRDPAGKDDLSYMIKKVVFKLHDTYHQPMRTIDQPPFEVTETGWGEFEVQISIYFTPVSAEKKTVLYHHLKLHPYGADLSNPPKPQPVESILYEELVFNEPTEPMLDVLMSRAGAVLLPRPLKPELPFSYQTEAEELDKLQQGLNSVNKQIEDAHIRIKELEAEKPTI